MKPMRHSWLDSPFKHVVSSVRWNCSQQQLPIMKLRKRCMDSVFCKIAYQLFKAPGTFSAYNVLLSLCLLWLPTKYLVVQCQLDITTDSCKVNGWPQPNEDIRSLWASSIVEDLEFSAKSPKLQRCLQYFQKTFSNGVFFFFLWMRIMS